MTVDKNGTMYAQFQYLINSCNDEGDIKTPVIHQSENGKCHFLENSCHSNLDENLFSVYNFVYKLLYIYGMELLWQKMLNMDLFDLQAEDF